MRLDFGSNPASFLISFLLQIVYIPMFYPRYAITDQLLANIKRINALVNEMNNKRFPHVVLLELERSAREVSTYASTSIEGNLIPLTEVKKVLKSKPAHVRESEKGILNYNQALQKLNKQIEEGKLTVSLNLILKIQEQVTNAFFSKV